DERERGAPRAVQPHPEVKTVPELLTAWAEAAGERTFLILPEDEGREVSFAAFDEAVDAAARALSARGAGPGTRVSLLLGNSLEMALLFLGAMRAGAVAHPINAHLAPAEIVQVLEDAAPALVCADEAGAAKLAEIDALPAPAYRAAGGLDLELIELAGARGPAAGAEPSPEGDALLIYTSGSTGRPKGVRLTHANLLAGARFVAEAHRLTPEDRSLVILPLYHINGEVIAFLAPLLSGGSVVLPGRFRADPFWGWALDCGCTWVSAVPTILSILLQRAEESPGAAEGLPGRMRFARSASAPLPHAVHTAFEARFGLPVIETMGITEGAGMVFTNPLPPGERKVGSVGRPWGCEARVVDEKGAPLPPGQEGEIEVRGESVTPGYFGNPTATAEALAGGWLRTGDLGYADAEGYYFITGRKKDLINRAGEKISPREVDEVLYRHPAVQDAAALGVPHPLYGEEVKAFVVLRPGAVCAEEEILAFCRERLAEFKCPKTTAFVPEIPKGPSGKLLRRKLKEMYLEEG
ncbi:MAG: AMP-binding protein, partial [bacterium]